MENKIDAILSEDQVWFRKNIDTREAILILKTIIELLLTQKNNLTMSTGQ